MVANSNNINEMSIHNAFTALENKINSFVSDFAVKELLSDKDKKVKVVFDTPFYASSLNNEFLEGSYYNQGYIKELYACFYGDNNEKLFISVGSTNNYIESQKEVDSEETIFTDLLIDDKAQVASELEDGNYFIVGNDFKNHCYKVIADSGEVYNEGDYITTTLLARDFLEGCNKVEDADFIGHIYSLLYNNKGDKLVNNICELWDGLKLEKVY